MRAGGFPVVLAEQRIVCVRNRLQFGLFPGAWHEMDPAGGR
jgi:hypothetical protein